MIPGELLHELSHGLVEVIHEKSGHEYKALSPVINATNENDGQQMILYGNEEGKLFVRELDEFCDKFKMKENE